MGIKDGKSDAKDAIKGQQAGQEKAAKGEDQKVWKGKNAWAPKNPPKSGSLRGGK